MGGGGSQNSTTTQKFEPPEWTQQGWQEAAGRAHDLASEPFQQYDLPTVAPFNDLQKSGLDMAVDYGMNGTPYGNQARSLGLHTMQGDFLNSNPYLDKQISDTAGNMAQSYAQGAGASLNAAMGRQGAFGGSAYNQLASQGAAGLAKSVGQMDTAARSQNYDYERGMQQQAMGMAPGFSADDFQGIKAVTGAGDAMGDYNQRLLTAGKNQFDQQVNYPQQQLQNYLNVLSQASGTNGGQTSTTSQPGMSPLAGLLGLGAGAYGISQFFK
jgi:hypothetical protein